MILTAPATTSIMPIRVTTAPRSSAAPATVMIRPIRNIRNEMMCRCRMWCSICALVDSAFAPGPFPFAQHELLDLAGRRLRQLAEMNGLRALEAGQARLAVVDNFLLSHRGAVAQDNEGLRCLAPIIVRNADHRYLEHGGMRGNGLLNLDRRDVLATANDDVLGPVAQFDVAVRVHHPEVAGVEPAAAERAVCRFLVPEVALHRVIAAHDHFAERLPVGRHIDLLVAHDTRIVRAHVAPAHRGHDPAALPDGQIVPSYPPRADRVRTPHLGQSVDMDALDPQ